MPLLERNQLHKGIADEENQTYIQHNKDTLQTTNPIKGKIIKC